MLTDQQKTFNVRCDVCRQETVIKMTKSQFDRYLKGEEHIQDILPNHSAEQRELLISRICGTCFDKIFE